MRQLSKSKIIAYRQCPKRLWLELHRPELKDDSGSEQAFAIGNQVGDIARTIYDPEKTGHLIDINETGWDAAFATTSDWLAEKEAPSSKPPSASPADSSSPTSCFPNTTEAVPDGT